MPSPHETSLCSRGSSLRGLLQHVPFRRSFCSADQWPTHTSTCSYGSFLLRDLPFDAIEFLAYETLKSR